MPIDAGKVAKELSLKLINDLSGKAIDAASAESAVLGAVTAEVFKVLASETVIDLFGDAIRDAIKGLSGDDYEALVSAESVVWEDNR